MLLRLPIFPVWSKDNEGPGLFYSHFSYNIDYFHSKPDQNHRTPGTFRNFHLHQSAARTGIQSRGPGLCGQDLLPGSGQTVVILPSQRRIFFKVAAPLSEKPEDGPGPDRQPPGPGCVFSFLAAKNPEYDSSGRRGCFGSLYAKSGREARSCAFRFWSSRNRHVPQGADRHSLQSDRSRLRCSFTQPPDRGKINKSRFCNLQLPLPYP